MDMIVPMYDTAVKNCGGRGIGGGGGGGSGKMSYIQQKEYKYVMYQYIFMT